ncbi:hypothetical protein [Photobacterium galatheae]|uniref:Lipoprotein n=1 Tax=Photobacterium galatheae TaxID=1654360 RepID=A0A066RTZ7_9GAMM|nr:hypothetical protein [Photobacterium galatheae]KDM91147.1 hypothetical protein EA58_13435 [Photobacterium galatheae]MCM0150131.1 hypothetical protein [Photobacterium galatheae]
MKKYPIYLSMAAVLMTGSAQAALNDYAVVLVHGFQADQLKSKPGSAQVATEGAEYWQEFWLARADARIDWPSHERIEGKIATDYLWPKLKELSQKGTCQAGCVFVTHSTGDLVTRYLIDNQANWLLNAGLEPLNIVATYDFAGAGGGSELGDMVVNVAEGGGAWNATLRYALSLWLGEIPDRQNTGVLNDLRVANARQLSALPDSRVPRLRFAGDSSDYLGVTSGFLPGHDDGVVASHSACGASAAGDFSSCSVHVAYNGKLATQSDGVSRFMPYHYPLLMGEDYSHRGLISRRHEGEVTTATAQATLLDGQVIRVNSTDEWYWLNGHYYRYVDGSDSKTISELAYNF